MRWINLLVVSTLVAGSVAAPLALRAEDAKKEKRPYVLDKCIVSDEKLGEMGKPYVFIYKDEKVKNDPGREIKFCCESCVKDFKKDPAKFLKKMDEAEAKEKAKK